MINNIKVLDLAYIFFAFFLSSCASLDIKPIGNHSNFVKESDEERLWKRCIEEQEVIARSGSIYDDINLNVYLNGLITKILPDDIKTASVNVKVFVIKDPEINACMFPNGVMYVHTGLLVNIDNEAQLIFILGHELVHFINRHSLKQFRNTINKSAFFATLSMVATSTSGLTGSPTDFSSLGMYNLISSVNGYSREQEYEADKGGFEALLKCNYPIAESINVIEIFEKEYKEDKDRKKIPYVFLDHPTNQARIKYLKKLNKSYENEMHDKGRLTEEEIYNKNICVLLLDNASLDIKASRFNSANRAIDRYLRLYPSDSKAYYLLGELFSDRNKNDDQKKAIENYKKSIELNNNFPLPYRDLGLIYYKQQLFDEARNEFETYLALLPNAEDKKYVIIYLDEIKKRKADK